MFKNLSKKLIHLKQRWEQNDHYKVTPIPEKSEEILDTHWESHRGSWHNLGSMSGIVGDERP